MNWDDARSQWHNDVSATNARGRAAAIALWATAALRVLKILAALMHAPLAAQFSIADFILLLITAVLFLRWLAAAIRISSQMSATQTRWTPSRAIWSFFLPIVSLWQPYQVVRDLHDQLAPDGVPEPAPRPRLDGSGGYRHVEMERAPPPRTLPHASIGAWWAFFICGRVVSFNADPSVDVVTQYSAAFDGCALIGALLAVLVVRAIDGRLMERLRRLHNASDAELDATHIRA